VLDVFILNVSFASLITHKNSKGAEYYVEKRELQREATR